MKVLRESSIIAFDVDETLIYWLTKDRYDNFLPLEKDKLLTLKYGGELCFFKKHEAHIRFLKHCKERGDYVEVWSANGFEWAEKVVKALNLEHHVDVARSKPSRHVDDKTDIPSIVGNHIFIKE